MNFNIENIKSFGQRNNRKIETVKKTNGNLSVSSNKEFKGHIQWI